jgi:hypothetical protein
MWVGSRLHAQSNAKASALVQVSIRRRVLQPRETAWLGAFIPAVGVA